MPSSLKDKRSAARKALRAFVGRGRSLTQAELNDLAQAVNTLIDDWRDEGDVVLHQGRPVDWIEFVRDEFQYNRIRLQFHFVGEIPNAM